MDIDESPLSLRGVFNMLLGVVEDEAMQGMVDQRTGQYFAIDTGFHLPKHLRTPSAIRQNMQYRLQKGEFGGHWTDDESAAKLRDNIEQALNDGRLRGVFHDLIQPVALQQRYPDVLEQRAEMTLDYMNQRLS